MESDSFKIFLRWISIENKVFSFSASGFLMNNSERCSVCSPSSDRHTAEKMALIVTALLVCVLARPYEPHYHHHSHPYHFGYKAKDHHGSHYRKEHGDGHGTVKGSYGYSDHHGNHRQVKYVADHHGFRAEIKTNEPGTANQSPAHVKLHAYPPYHHQYPAHHYG